MNYIKTFESFLHESNVSAEVANRMSAQDCMDKIANLKKELTENPEQRDYVLAKIQVEIEKLDVIVAKRNLMTAKEREEYRKEKEKAQKELAKDKESRRKEMEKKFKNK